MKKLFAVVIAVVMVATLSGVALAGNNGNGNGAPSGKHYNLNLIGVKYEKDIVDCGNGHRIFVGLGGEFKGNPNKPKADPTVDIYLEKATEAQVLAGEGFKVLDCDGTDGKARFRLPDPDPGDEDPCTAYSVYIRIRGKPGGNFKMRTCGEVCLEWDTSVPPVCIGGWERVCSTEQLDMTRLTGKGKNKFSNVSKELLTMCVEVCVPDNGGEICEWQRIYIFDAMFENYLWEYDSTGAKNVQLRFYPEETCYPPDNGNPWSCP